MNEKHFVHNFHYNLLHGMRLLRRNHTLHQYIRENTQEEANDQSNIRFRES